LVAYLSSRAVAKTQLAGALIYPIDPSVTGLPPAEIDGPWQLDHEKKLWFLTIPHEAEEAATKIRETLALGA
jgi:hypothetical protein